MLFAASLLLGIAQPSAETTLPLRVAEVAVFKPGLVFVTREGILPPGTKTYRLDSIPQAFDGTLWYDSPDGATLSEMRTTLDVPQKSREARSIVEILLSNEGKSVSLVVATTGGREKVVGRLLSFSPDGNQLTLKVGTRFRKVDLADVVEVDAAGLNQTVARPVPTVALRFRAAATKQSHVRFVSLEAGAAWAANYRLHVDGDRGELSAAAQLGLGKLALNGSRVRLVSGLPNLGAAKQLDLASGGGSLTAYLQGSSSSFSSNERDPYEALEEFLSGSRRSYPDGLFRGGRPDDAPKNDALSVASYATSSDNPFQTGGTVLRRDSPQFVLESVAASRLEDMHVYPFGTVTLPAGGRITRNLWDAQVPLHTLYRWRVGESGSFERNLRIRNSTENPWPSGGVMLEADGIPLAQVAMPFTAPGQEASLVLGPAEDIIHTFENRETGREEISPRPNVKTVSVSNESVVSVTNTRSEPIEVELVYEVAGVVQDPAGGTVRQVARADRANPTSVITWRMNLVPGERKEWTVKFKQNLM